jgi:single-stranded DNA-binding protein
MERMNEVRCIGAVGMIKPSDKHVYLAVALNESYKQKEATEWTNKTVWLDVVAFGPVRERIMKADIQVGDTILLLGKLDQTEFEGKKQIKIQAQKVQLIKKSDKKQFESSDLEEPTPATNSNDDDLPF